MQNRAFWCILGSENGQLLTGGSRRHGYRVQGLGGERGDADVRGAKSAETSNASREMGRRREFPLHQPSLGEHHELPSGVRGGQALVENGFIGLTIGAKMIGGGRPLLRKILSQSDRVGAKFEQ